MKEAPKWYKGKRLVFEEVFRSSGFHPTKEAAEKVLDNIRLLHNELYGWHEISGGVFQDKNGWRAVRHHAKYE